MTQVQPTSRSQDRGVGEDRLLSGREAASGRAVGRTLTWAGLDELLYLRMIVGGEGDDRVDRTSAVGGSRPYTRKEKWNVK
ncbi:MAG: hypothetical protein ACP5HS_06605 [Anaerolineae bacterium]